MLATIEFKESREALLARLTTAAYQVALRHDEQCSFTDLELGLWRALRSALIEPESLQPTSRPSAFQNS